MRGHRMEAEECENKVRGCTGDASKPKNYDVSSRYAKHARVLLMMDDAMNFIYPLIYVLGTCPLQQLTAGKMAN